MTVQHLILYALAMPFALSGCAWHEVSETPSPLVPIAQAFNAQPASTNTNAQALTQPWYHAFNDQVLNRLIAQALNQGYDIQQAAARYQQVLALSQQAKATQLPELTLGATAGRNLNNDSQTEQAEITLAWEADLFGHLTASVRASQRRLEASAADLAAMRMLIASQVSEAYLGAVTRQAILAELRKQVQADTELLKLIQRQFDEGLGTQLEILQQQSQLAQIKSTIPLIEAELYRFENQLDILIGEAPNSTGLTSADDLPTIPRPLSASGVPSDLLLNRPDLRARQLRLQAVDEEIKIAIAEQMPRLNLTGSMALTSSDGTGGVMTSVLAGLVQPLLDWGKRRAAISFNKAVYQEDLLSFTQAFISAVAEVENTLVEEQKRYEQMARLDSRLIFQQAALTKAKSQFSQGATDYLAVLMTNKELNALQRERLIEQEKLLRNRIRLHLALGSPVTPTDLPIESSKP